MTLGKKVQQASNRAMMTGVDLGVGLSGPCQCSSAALQLCRTSRVTSQLWQKVWVSGMTYFVAWGCHRVATGG